MAPKTIQICTAGECGGDCYRCRVRRLVEENEALKQQVIALRDFARLVGYMRSSQRQFFESRSQAALSESRRYEKRVDEILKTLESPRLLPL